MLTELVKLTLPYKMLQIFFVALPETLMGTEVFPSHTQGSVVWLAVMQGYTDNICIGWIYKQQGKKKHKGVFSENCRAKTESWSDERISSSSSFLHGNTFLSLLGNQCHYLFPWTGL